LLIAELDFIGFAIPMHIEDGALHASIEGMGGQIHDQFYYVELIHILHQAIP